MGWATWELVLQIIIIARPDIIAVVFVSTLLASWLWIALRGSSASAWGSPPCDQESAPSGDNDAKLSENDMQHLRGRSCWLNLGVVVWLLVFGELMHSQPVLGVSYVLCFLPSFLLLFVGWFRIGSEHGVPGGLLVNFFLSGALLSTTLCMLPEAFVAAAAARAFPECHRDTLGPDGNITASMGETATPNCQMAIAAQTTFGPGLFEESLKAIWLFYRLRRQPADVPERCCCCFPSFGGVLSCRCWYKLATTPYHVLLCALSAGAGFECFENMLYVFVYSRRMASPHGGGHHDDEKEHIELQAAQLGVALSRTIFSTLHMLWTGLVGIGLAKRMFYPAGQRPWLITVLLPPILLHGCFDYSLAAAEAARASNSGNLYEFSAFMLLAGAVVCSCSSFCGKTGCRVTCCLHPGFWKEDFGYVSAFVPSLAPSSASSHGGAAGQPLLSQA
eukprot:TRINITY_DN41174_c0_g1_i1.p1 TRINITY_DN41174_c0_g1~~TRINITY_DN41174_c0_g1_i1.p1  ORF type:complete len:447 (+),score=31.21 TRINITY_DN41174_c0_g1_i1:51-1391(+)